MGDTQKPASPPPGKGVPSQDSRVEFGEKPGQPAPTFDHDVSNTMPPPPNPDRGGGKQDEGK